MRWVQWRFARKNFYNFGGIKNGPGLIERNVELKFKLSFYKSFLKTPVENFGVFRI